MWNLNSTITNKRNNQRFNDRGCSLFFLMGIFLKHLWLIPNILKWQDYKVFTKLVPSQTSSRSSHQRCSVKSVLETYKNHSISTTTSPSSQSHQRLFCTSTQYNKANFSNWSKKSTFRTVEEKRTKFVLFINFLIIRSSRL